MHVLHGRRGPGSLILALRGGKHSRTWHGAQGRKKDPKLTCVEGKSRAAKGPPSPLRLQPVLWGWACPQVGQMDRGHRSCCSRLCLDCWALSPAAAPPQTCGSSQSSPSRAAGGSRSCIGSRTWRRPGGPTQREGKGMQGLCAQGLLHRLGSRAAQLFPDTGGTVAKGFRAHYDGAQHAQRGQRKQVQRKHQVWLF